MALCSIDTPCLPCVLSIKLKNQILMYAVGALTFAIAKQGSVQREREKWLHKHMHNDCKQVGTSLQV